MTTIIVKYVKESLQCPQAQGKASLQIILLLSQCGRGLSTFRNNLRSREVHSHARVRVADQRINAIMISTLYLKLGRVRLQ